MSDSTRPATNTTTGLAELATVTRSGMIESRHFGTLVAVDPSGATVIEVGDADASILPRSTVKPLQALACLTAGAPLEGAELAIAAGSHTGEDTHVRVVDSILTKAGLDEGALGCPVDRPEDEGTFETLLAAGHPRSRVRMNCSGKHAAMLSACVASGWPTDTYLDPEHPLQQHIRATMEQMTGITVVHTAIDGCGAPLFDTTPRGLAQAFRALALSDPSSPAGRVGAAMREHSFFVGGSGHPNSTLMETVPGAVAKGGAEGVIGVAAADGTAVSMKIVDGSPRATTLLALRTLEALGVDVSGATALTTIPVLGGGVAVGEIDIGHDLERALLAHGSHGSHE